MTPILAPMPRGILAAVTARPARPVDAAHVHAALADAYAGEPFVHVLPAGQQPHTAATLGSNSAHLQASVDLDLGRIVVTSAIDNLGRVLLGGGAERANIMVGLPEMHRPVSRRDSAMSVTSAMSYRAAGAVGLKPGGARDVALRPATARTTPQLGCSPATASRRRRCVVAAGSRSTRRLRAVVLNSGGAQNADVGAGFADTHRTAEHAAGALLWRRRRGRLLNRPRRAAGAGRAQRQIDGCCFAESGRRP